MTAMVQVRTPELVVPAALAEVSREPRADEFFKSRRSNLPPYEPYPEIKIPKARAFLYRLCVQMKASRLTYGETGLLRPNDEVGHELYTTVLGKVISIGPTAFTYREGPNAGQPWPGGVPCKVGDEIRIRLHGGESEDLTFEDLPVAIRVRWIDDLDVVAGDQGEEG